MQSDEGITGTPNISSTVGQKIRHHKTLPSGGSAEVLRHAPRDELARPPDAAGPSPVRGRLRIVYTGAWLDNRSPETFMKALWSVFKRFENGETHRGDVLANETIARLKTALHKETVDQKA